MGLFGGGSSKSGAPTTARDKHEKWLAAQAKLVKAQRRENQQNASRKNSGKN